MTPDVVADVGNTRIKWGRCSTTAVVESAALPPGDPEAWQRQAETWLLPRSATWAIAGVQPARRDRLAAWIRQRGDILVLLDDWRRLPLMVNVPEPSSVGIDRLLDAVAVNALRRAHEPAVVIDAGTAVTVDWIDGCGAFSGGTILPGPGLMLQALHAHTALLPLVDVPTRLPVVPGTTTTQAMEAGVFWAVAGGVWGVVAAYARRFDASPAVFLTGGAASLIAAAALGAVQLCPLLTLEGIRLAARVSEPKA